MHILFTSLNLLNICQLIGFSLFLEISYSPAVGSRSVEEKPVECNQPLESPTHQFLPGSDADQLRQRLEYYNKPYWPMQWYLNEETLSADGRTYSPSMKIAQRHEEDMKGKRVTIVIIGNSKVDCSNEEIKQRCSPYPHRSKGIMSLLNLGKSNTCSVKSLSTAAAGIIGMRDDGFNCGVGVAPKCNIQYLVVKSNSKNEAPEYQIGKTLSPSPGRDEDHVFVHVWSLPNFDYKNRILKALYDIKLLDFDLNRQTQARPHVMGSGNYGLFANSCQCNEYTSADSMFVFGSVAYNGFLTPYSETCASLIGVTYSTSDGNNYYNNIITIRDSTITKSPTDLTKPTYATKRTTAISAAIGGGIIALISEMFMKYHSQAPSFSDVAFLLAFSSASADLEQKNTLWFTNGVGLKYSPQAGFGLPQLDKVEEILRNGWTPLNTPTTKILFDHNIRPGEIPCSPKDISSSIRELSCRFDIPYDDAQANYHIQSVTVELSSIMEAKRGAFAVFVISAAGTVSCILEARPYDIHKKNHKKVRLRTNHFIGETLAGHWTILFYSYQEDSKFTSSNVNTQQSTQPLSGSLQRSSSYHYSGESDIPSATPTNSQSSPNQKRNGGNTITRTTFRFLLVERLPSFLPINRKKSSVQTNWDLKHIVDWVTFRYQLLLKTDPKGSGFRRVELSEVYDKTNDFMKYAIQKQKGEEDQLFRRRT